MEEVFTMIWSWMYENASVLMFLALAIGLGVSYRQLRLIKKTGQAELMNNMSQYWDSQMIEARKAILERKTGEALRKDLEKCVKEEKYEELLTLTRVGNFFELMGNLARRGAIDTDIIAGKFRTQIKDYYGLYKPFIDQKRKAPPDERQKTVYEHFEWLAKKMKWTEGKKRTRKI